MELSYSLFIPERGAIQILYNNNTCRTQVFFNSGLRYGNLLERSHIIQINIQSNNGIPVMSKNLSGDVMCMFQNGQECWCLD